MISSPKKNENDLSLAAITIERIQDEQNYSLTSLDTFSNETLKKTIIKRYEGDEESVINRSI